MRYPILEVCARIEGHAIQHQMLRDYCKEFEDWQGLLKQAELEGMAPLLRKHLVESGSDLPATVRRSLNILYKRHQKQAKIRTNILQEILELFRSKQLTPILIKGSALCHTIYSDPALRPMRDMDILLRRTEIDVALDLLINAGFNQSHAPNPAEPYHLSALFKIVNGITVCVELHKGLYQDCPPYYPEVNFEKFLATAQQFKVENTKALMFNDEEMLHYLYQHAFHPPLTYESYRLINAADIIGFVEKRYHTLDWEKIRKQYPLLYNALPLLHHISPWDFDTIPEDFVHVKERTRRVEPLAFTGWPQKRLKEQKAEGRKMYQILFDTFLPPSWWLQMYYGVATKRGCLWCILWRHLCHVMWWKRLFSSLKG